MSSVAPSARAEPPDAPSPKKPKTAGKENVSPAAKVNLQHAAMAALTTGSVDPRTPGNVLPSRADSAWHPHALLRLVLKPEALARVTPGAINATLKNHMGFEQSGKKIGPRGFQDRPFLNCRYRTAADFSKCRAGVRRLFLPHPCNSRNPARALSPAIYYHPCARH
jgi:hypothetical protein